MDAGPPTIVLLHGAVGSAVTMTPLADALAPTIQTHAFNLIGHGGRPVPERCTLAEFALDVIAQMDERALPRAHVFGYSSGGTIALYLARHFPERFLSVCTLATKHVFDRRTLAHWTFLADPERLRRSKNSRKAESARLHLPQDWLAVIALNRRMFEEFGRRRPLNDHDLRAISVPALFFSSDEDQLVPLDETIALGKLMRDGRVVIFKGRCHPFEIVPIGAMAKAMTNWIDEVQARALPPKTSA